MHCHCLHMWDLGTDAKWNNVCLRHKWSEGWLCMQSQFLNLHRSINILFFPIWSLIYRPPGWDSFWNQHHQTHTSQNLMAFISTHCNFVPVSVCSNCRKFSSISGGVWLFSLYNKRLISCDWKDAHNDSNCEVRIILGNILTAWNHRMF